MQLGTWDKSGCKSYQQLALHIEGSECDIAVRLLLSREENCAIELVTGVAGRAGGVLENESVFLPRRCDCVILIRCYKRWCVILARILHARVGGVLSWHGFTR